ncbi:MAG: M42 family metallopeptidase [Methanomicrobia archaeon]|nr:M42 family metallopeptidase [Methanomicrobia archaeon]
MLLKELSNANGISGFEDEVRDLIKSNIPSYETDVLGNLVSSKEGKGLKVMLAAHMDEVGLIVVDIDEDGYILFKKAGGIDDRVLMAKRVIIGKNRINGVIGSKPIHLLKKEDLKKVVEYDKLYIDIGAKNKKETEKLIKIGDPVYFATMFKENGYRFIGKALDDRVGCSIILDMLKKDFSFSLCGAFTVQEEVGLRGAQVVAHDINPDICIVLEGTFASDTPDIEEKLQIPKFGEGPAITFADRSVICDPKLVRFFKDTAEKNDIPYQIKRPFTGGTDAGAIHLTKKGIPSGVIALPSRYIHAPASIGNKEDYENMKNLVYKILERIESEKGDFYGH